MSSLKVLSVFKNQITHLPVCLADMPSLHWIKLAGNPLVYPDPYKIDIPGTGPNPPVDDKEINDHRETDATAAIKKFLKEERYGAAGTGSGASSVTAESPTESVEGGETPRPTMKRVFSGRFPVKVNGNEVPDLRSPAAPRPPPIPMRSHYRGLSQQNAAHRKPGVAPLVMGNLNERVRSNSETAYQPSSRERSESRSRRMGMVSKRSELSTLEEIEVNPNRFSHYRGLSHGSAMQGHGPGLQVKSPNLGSPAEPPALQRPVYVRRLSVLPERRRESKIFDPVLEAAKGVLYSIFQIHPMIQTLVGLTNNGSAGRSNLEIVFYNTNDHVEQLEMEIQKQDQAINEGHGQRENENVQRACLTLINAYTHVCSLLMANVDVFLEYGDPRYIRTLLLQLYNSVMELRVTCNQVAPPPEDISRPPTAMSRHELGENTIRPYNRDVVTPTPGDRSVINGRPRNGNCPPQPSNLRVATEVPSYINGGGRNNYAAASAATPQSGESFASTSTIGTRNLSADFTEEDRAFERIFLALQKTTELVMRTLPGMNAQFMSSMRAAAAQRSPEHVIQCWRALIVKCNTTIQQTEGLKARLSTIKLKEPGIRTQITFWRLCNAFIDSWYVLVKKIMQFQNDVALPADTKARLRPIQQAMKETLDLMMSSPWGYYLRQSAGPEHPAGPGAAAGAAGVSSPSAPAPPPPTPLPMTPQSAALGPAVQATVPSTPQSASFNIHHPSHHINGLNGHHPVAAHAQPHYAMSDRTETASISSGFSSASTVVETSRDFREQAPSRRGEYPPPPVGPVGPMGGRRTPTLGNMGNAPGGLYAGTGQGDVVGMGVVSPGPGPMGAMGGFGARVGLSREGKVGGY